MRSFDLSAVAPETYNRLAQARLPCELPCRRSPGSTNWSVIWVRRAAGRIAEGRKGRLRMSDDVIFA
jgi:hypothetical protein